MLVPKLYLSYLLFTEITHFYQWIYYSKPKVKKRGAERNDFKQERTISVEIDQRQSESGKARDLLVFSQ